MTSRSSVDDEQHARQCRLEAICAAGERVEIDLPIDRAAYLLHYYAQAEAEEIERDPEMLARAALGHLAWARARKPGSAIVRVFNPTRERDGWTSEHTVVETVNDDMPFLVDSLAMTLTGMNQPIHVTLHPLLQIERSAKGELKGVQYSRNGDDGDRAKTESFIHFEIVRETDASLLAAIEAGVASALRAVRAAVEDWPKMLERLRVAASDLRATGGLPQDLKAEAGAFLEWLARDHFTLLGYREYELVEGAQFDELKARPGTGLGLLRADGNDASTRLAGRAREEARSQNPLVITKASERSPVHRSAPLDHIGVKVFDDKGKPVLERRFLGLFTSVAYHHSPRTIPLLRLKIRLLMDQSGFDPRSHRGKSLQHILDTLPRDDLFQASLEDLRLISRGVLGLEDRHKLKLFVRRETFGRFYSCLVYLPRDQYNSRARRAIETILMTGLGGNAVESELNIADSALARLAVTVRTLPGQHADPDVPSLQRQLENTVRTWQDRVREALLSQLPEERALDLLHRFGEHFSAAYQDEADAARACVDIQRLALIDEHDSDLEIALVRSASDRPGRLRLTTIKRDEPIQLYVALPVLENMGFKVISERVYPVRRDANPLWVQDFELETANKQPLDPATVDTRFRQTFALVLRGEAENDSFNSFVISAGLDWRQAVLLRAFCKYLLQTGLRYSQAYMQGVLARYPAYCRALIEKFGSMFDVDRPNAARAEQLAASDNELKRELDRTVSLDDDRILRAYGAVVNAILRTNYYQLARPVAEGASDAGGAPKTYISFKLDPTLLPDLPKPRPKYEIFVYSQRVEGVHLRSSKIARGGIRWSDRREDFRTEVLGLMKAQQVKNTVIVPNGAKGGFVGKQLPAGDRDAIQREVVACYQTFIRGLLDITDNIVDGRVVPPQRVLRRDDDDPYLVVAADKGTATFSDIANALSAEYAHWLGDAFASGGSAGYDHKKMAITARGAWEAVKRHFRELGVHVHAQDFTVAGIGDMSGDVFGNGMLLSPHIKLVAAFDHRHIFIDPSPDPAASIAERRRLFELPRSSWDDYDRKALSEGGDVYSRQTKSIDLHPKAQALLDLPSATVTPLELIRAVLRARVDLFWNGGIGTYVKASTESHLDAGDPVNDAVRVNGAELRCRVVAEGGNLGFTQRGRVEYASGGGKINTDFIDNSGGVDSSDREVNIKILLEDAIRQKKLPRGQRNALLAEMTDQIAALVLGSNYAQTQALSMMDSRAAERLGEHARLIRVLETQGLLDRALEFLPTEVEIEERRASGRGLTRPELAIILSYSKIELHGSLLQTDIPEDPFLAAELELYFPRQLSERFKASIGKHRLRREIIAMLVGGSMINRMGPFFVLRAEEETGASVAQVARAYAIVREVFGVRKLWREIELLDHKVDAKVQYDAIFQISRMLRRAVYWLLQNYSQQLDIESMVKRFQPGVADAFAALPKLVTSRSDPRYAKDAQQLESVGLPAALARQIAALSLMTQTFDVIELAREFRLSVPEVGQLYFALAKELRLDVLREQIEALPVEGRWRAMARATLRETLAQEQRALLRSALSAAGSSANASAALAAWLEKRRADIARVQRGLDDMLMSGALDFATLSVALKEVSRLV
jgi:glutamate dehydrogenase